MGKEVGEHELPTATDDFRIAAGPGTIPGRLQPCKGKMLPFSHFPSQISTILLSEVLAQSCAETMAVLNIRIIHITSQVPYLKFCD